MTLVEDWIKTWNNWMTLNDKRVASWPLMVTPWPTIYITMAYIIIVTAGPKILRGKSFELRNIVLGYNLFTVLLNAYIAYELYANTIGYYYWPCEEVDYTVNERSMRIAAGIWWFYISKAFEMLDSIFFMLRGKYNQLSFLHIYHHSSMFLLWWMGANYVPGGNTVFGAALNSAIHVVMYGYYFVSALGPQYRKYLGWKQYLTIIQITQFFINLGFLLNFLVFQPCDFPLWMPKLMTAYMISFIILFGNFYMRTYKKKPKAAEKKTE